MAGCRDPGGIVQPGRAAQPGAGVRTRGHQGGGGGPVPAFGVDALRCSIEVNGST